MGARRNEGGDSSRLPRGWRQWYVATHFIPVRAMIKCPSKSSGPVILYSDLTGMSVTDEAFISHAF